MSDDRRRARQLVTLAGAVLAGTGVVAVGCGIASQDPAPPSPGGRAADSGSMSDSDEPAVDPAAPTASEKTGEGTSGGANQADPQETGPPQTDPAEQSEPLTLDYSQPVRVEIPGIGVSSTLEELELNSAGEMEVPADPDKAGWFTPAPPPGVPGVSVISGHVTWNQDPVVFFRLGDLRAGDKIRVQRADGVTAVFTVERIGEFAKSTFPTKAVYTPTEGAGIRLITCGGQYDDVNNRYLSNVIVWATMTSYHRA